MLPQGESHSSEDAPCGNVIDELQSTVGAASSSDSSDEVVGALTICCGFDVNLPIDMCE